MPESDNIEQIKDYSLEFLNALDQLATSLRNVQFFYGGTFSAMYYGNILGVAMTLMVGSVAAASYIAALAAKKERKGIAFANSNAFIDKHLREAKKDQHAVMTKEELDAALENLCKILNEEMQKLNEQRYEFYVASVQDKKSIQIKKKNLTNVSKTKAPDEDTQPDPSLLPGVLGEIQRFFRKPAVGKAITTATLYMMGYWILWMIMQIVAAFAAVATVALLPLYLQFILPSILPMAYMMFSSDKKPEKDEEMEAARVLAIQAFMMRVQKENFEAELKKAKEERALHSSSDQTESVAEVCHQPAPVLNGKITGGSVTQFRARLLETRPKSKFLFGFIGTFMFVSFALWPLMDFLGSYGGWLFFAGLGGVAVPFFTAVVVGVIAGVIAYKMANKKHQENEARLNKAGLTEEAVWQFDAQVAEVEALKAEIADLRRQLGDRANDSTLNPQVHFPEYNDHTFFTFGHLKTTQKEHRWSRVKKFLYRLRVFLNDTGSLMFMTRATYMVLAFCGAFVLTPSPVFIVFAVALVIGVLYGVMGAYQKYHKNQQEKRDDALLQRFQVAKETLTTHRALLTMQRDHLRESVGASPRMVSVEKIAAPVPKTHGLSQVNRPVSVPLHAFKPASHHVPG